jgi:hypothetical protein
VAAVVVAVVVVAVVVVPLRCDLWDMGSEGFRVCSAANGGDGGQDGQQDHLEDGNAL